MNTGRTPLFLMANLGSETERMLRFKESGDTEQGNKSLERSLGIIKEIETFPEMRARQKELDILKDVLESVLHSDKWSVDPKDLRNYFTPFALRLMR